MTHPRIIAAALSKHAGFSVKDGKHCTKCRNAYNFINANAASKPGDVYSPGGRRETQLSGFCEWCFDNEFGGEQ